MQASTPPMFGLRSASDRLGAWNLYFVAKLVLVVLGLVGVHLLANLAFVVVLAAMAHPAARRFRPWVGVPVAVALLYYDSWLPGFSRVVSQAGLIAGFSGAYLAELAGRFVNVTALAAMAIAVTVGYAALRFLRIDVLVVAAILAVALLVPPPKGTLGAATPVAAAAVPGAPAARNPDEVLADFFRTESERSVAFPAPPANAPPFDVIFVHVCSLSWDDLEATGLDQHPLFAGFDIVLERFNAVSTYSGPAAIRFLRAPCGQPSHKALYEPAPPQCLLMPALKDAGFEPTLLLNHDGHFDDFLAHVRDQGMQAQPQSLKGVDAPQRAFDDSRIYDDAAILARWLKERGKAPAAREAVYFNTLSLHDGNRLLTQPSVKSSETYKARLKALLDELSGFMDQLASSGRRAVVVLIPEHGAAWRGDAAQIAGLRDIPTPAITLVPVGIRVIGPDARRQGPQVRSAEATSFLAVSHLVSRMLARPPFGAPGFNPADYTAGMPTTPFVSEGENAVLLKRGEAYLIRQEQDPWKEYR